VLDHLFAGNLDYQVCYLPLCWLLASSAMYKDLISQEIRARIDALIASSDPAARQNGLRLAIWGPYGITWFGDNGPHIAQQHPLARFWRDRRDDNVRDYADLIVSEAPNDPGMRNTAIWANLITVDQALEMPGGVVRLFRNSPTGIFGGRWGSEILSSARNLANGRPSHHLPDGMPTMVAQVAQFAALGQYFMNRPAPPWIQGKVELWPGYFASHPQDAGEANQSLDSVSYLGAAITLLIAAEAAGTRVPPPEGRRWFGPLADLYPYVLSRWGLGTPGELGHLQIPSNFRSLFRDWATRKIDFVSP
jgi:hypothetical protein